VRARVPQPSAVPYGARQRTALPSFALAVTKMKMRSASLWLGIGGGIFMVLLMAKGFRGAIM
jgi:hypothetical protein